MNEIRKELMQLLKEIYDNKDFVCGVMSNAGREEAWEKIRDYILYTRENGQSLSSDDLLLLSLSLGKKEDTKTDHNNERKAVKAAVW